MGRSAADGVYARDLAGELRVLKAASGLGLVQLAALTSFSKSALERYFNGKVLPPQQAVEAISRVCGGDTARLVALWELAYKPPRAAAADSPAGRQQRPAQLPHDVAGFTGREAELARLLALLPGGGRAVVISAIGGAAGIGKTALAVHFAHQVADRFPGGQLYINLRGFDPDHAPLLPSQALAQFLRALGLAPQHLPTEPGEQAALFRSQLADRRMLIVLDNAANIEQVRALLPGAPGCLVLVTSRNRLGGLVARHGAHHIALDALTPAEAIDLLAVTVGAERVAAERGAAAEVARLCGYLPLALRIAAEHITTRPHLTLADLIDDLANEDRRLDVLTTGDETTAIRMAFSWSYQALPADAAQAFRLLGLHDGPDITTSAAAALTGITAQRVRRLLDVLTTAHLIEQTGRDHYHLHDLLHIYAAERANAEETKQSRAEARHRILAWHLHTPNVARIYDFFLGGKNNYAADRAAAAQFIKLIPEAQQAARTNRDFMARAVRFSASEGIRQFVDIGTGLPTQGNVHEIAHTIDPQARVAYIDNDPIVVTHARALLEGEGTTAVINSDLRRPQDILASPRLRELIDLDQPIALLLVAVLHYFPDTDHPEQLVRELARPLAPGSLLVISHGSNHGMPPDTAAQARQVYERANLPLYSRSPDQLASFFTGFDLVEPGIVWASQWHPDPQSTTTAPLEGRYLSALGRKPTTN